MPSHKFSQTIRQNPMLAAMALLNLSLFVFAFLLQPPMQVLAGFVQVILAPCGLITDYMALAGAGAAFFNAGVVMLVGVAITLILKLHYTGATVASLSLMAGFALFGKNALNILPILLGVYLYSLFQRESFSKYVYMAFFGTCLGPVVSEFAVYLPFSLPVRLGIALLAGLLIGFILPPIGSYTLRIHQGYDLYNMALPQALWGCSSWRLPNPWGMCPNTPTTWGTGYNFAHGGIFVCGFLFDGLP